MPSRTVAFATLGCKVNQYDTEAMMALFRRAGYELGDFDRTADVYVINTCAVTGKGAAKSRQLVRQATRRNPEAVVIVAGCYPQTAAGEVLAIPGVSVAIGTQDRGRVVELVEEAIASGSAGGDGGQNRPPISAVGDIRKAREFEETPIEEFAGRTRAAVKVQEGCNQYCTYCIIPYARGPVRSRRPESIRQEVERLAAAGFKEVVLTGIHLGSYGLDLMAAGQYLDQPTGQGLDHPSEQSLGQPVTLAGIVRMIHEINGIQRIRLSSLEPRHITDELIELIAHWPKVCRHLHLSLQSGSDEVLRRMRRRYDKAEYRSIVEKIRRAVPEIGLSTDVMAGFPGETEELFEESYQFVREMGFSRLHVFPYSPRKGTPAAAYPGQVPGDVKDERSRRLIELGHEMALSFHRRFQGSVMEILVEEESSPDSSPVARSRVGENLEGYTDNYIRVTLRGPDTIRNQLTRVRMVRAESELVHGELAMDPE